MIIFLLKKTLIASSLAILLSFYFVMTLVIMPQEYSSLKVIEPQPIHLVSISDDKITLGSSFKIEIEMTNKNDSADIVLTSVGFPSLTNLDSVEVIGYDFTQSPKKIDIGYKIGSEYTFGESISAKYPLIEADSRNVPEDYSARMVLLVTPQKAGTFEMYVKTIAIPHTTEHSHFPYEGLIDPQKEFVDVYSVVVEA